MHVSFRKPNKTHRVVDSEDEGEEDEDEQFEEKAIEGLSKSSQERSSSADDGDEEEGDDEEDEEMEEAEMEEAEDPHLPEGVLLSFALWTMVARRPEDLSFFWPCVYHTTHY